MLLLNIYYDTLSKYVSRNFLEVEKHTNETIP